MTETVAKPDSLAGGHMIFIKARQGGGNRRLPGFIPRHRRFFAKCRGTDDADFFAGPERENQTALEFFGMRGALRSE